MQFKFSNIHRPSPFPLPLGEGKKIKPYSSIFLSTVCHLILQEGGTMPA